MLKKFKEKLFLPKRGVHFSPETQAGSGDAVPEIDVKKIEAQESQDMMKIAERIKTLKLGDSPIQIGGDGKKVNVLTFQNTLKESLKKVPGIDSLKVKNLDLFLLNGLLQNIGKADNKPSIVNPQSEGPALNAFLKDNKITKFNIKDGNWEFFTETEIVPAPNSLRDASVTPEVKKIKEQAKAKEETEKKTKRG